MAVDLGSSSSSPFSRLQASLLIMLAVAVILGGIGVYSLVKKTQQRLAQKTAALAIELETTYENPFEQNTQYVNPFDEFKNPLRNL